jgi:hypothetical protein
MEMLAHAEVDGNDVNLLDLLPQFLSAAVGMRLLARVSNPRNTPIHWYDLHVPSSCEPPVGAAWTTETGLLWARGAYDRAQSQRLRCHVMFIEWWSPSNERHASWWRCPKTRPREWVAGRGG